MDVSEEAVKKAWPQQMRRACSRPPLIHLTPAVRSINFWHALKRKVAICLRGGHGGPHHRPPSSFTIPMTTNLGLQTSITPASYGTLAIKMQRVDSSTKFFFHISRLRDGIPLNSIRNWIISPSLSVSLRLSLSLSLGKEHRVHGNGTTMWQWPRLSLDGPSTTRHSES